MLNDANPAPRKIHREKLFFCLWDKIICNTIIHTNTLYSLSYYIFILHIKYPNYIICNNPLQMSTPTSDSIALIWTEHAMGLHPIFFFWFHVPWKTNDKG